MAKIADQTRHASLDMILVYQKSAELLSADDAGAGTLGVLVGTIITFVVVTAS